TKDEDAIARHVVEANKLVGLGDLDIQALPHPTANKLRRFWQHALRHPDAVVIEYDLRTPVCRLRRQYAAREAGHVGWKPLTQTLPSPVTEDRDVLAQIQSPPATSRGTIALSSVPHADPKTISRYEFDLQFVVDSGRPMDSTILKSD